MHILFSCILVDPRNFTQLKDPGRELEISLFSYLRVLSNFGKEDHLIYLFHLQLFFQYQKYKRGNNMTFPKYRKNEDLINRSNFVCRSLFAFYLDREKCAFSKIAFSARRNVHFVWLIFRSRGKFTLDFSAFV